MIYRNIDRTLIYQSDEFPLGALGTDQDGNLYRFIKYNDGDGAPGSTTAGYLLVYLDTGFDRWEATDDLNSSTIKAVLQAPAGFVQAALTDGEYGWAQISGYNKVAMLTDEGISQGEQLMAHATTTGAVDSHDAAAKAVVGVALEADTVAALSAGQALITIGV